MKCKNVPAILNKLINNERWFADNHLQQVVEFTFSDRRLNWRTDSGSPISDFFPYDDQSAGSQYGQVKGGREDDR